MKRRVRLVFAHIVKDPAFTWLAGELGWRPAGELKEYVQAFERVWIVDDVGKTVIYLDDKLVELQYLIVDGTDEEVQAIREKVSSRVPLYTKHSVPALMDPAGQTYDPVLGLYVAAVIAQPEKADPEILSWIRDAMHDRNPEVRRGAYFATTYPGWREFEPLLVKAANEDPDAEARDLATRALDSLRRNVWKEG